MSGFSLGGNGWSRRVHGQAACAITYNARTHKVARDCDGAVLGDDVFTVLDELVAEDPTAMWVGYFGYACRSDLQARAAEGVPDAVWMKADGSTVRMDGSTVRMDGSTSPRSVSSPPASYREAFAEVQQRLRAGDSYEVNLTRRVDLEGGEPADPADVYARLCAINPAPYAGHLWYGGTHVLSASPECFVSIDRGRVRTKPIKGTTPRGSDPLSDEGQRFLLANDPRFRAENLMITDLMRNDLAQVCVPGTVEVTALMKVESYAAVHQLVSTIEGDLAPSTSVVEAVRALYPAGSMTGAPKRRTMEIIDALEETPRGVYSGALGWIRGDACQLSVVIRSLIRDPDLRWHAGTGGGITVHSELSSEWDESEWKLNRLVSALGSPNYGGA